VDKFDAMQIFVRVIEKGSFSAVARERGLGQPAISKQISALESELGTELIHRNSRSIALTEAGATFTNLLCTFSTTLKTRLHESVEGKLHRKASFV
jgi:DNA-binding transcriptional LysR family regulator